MTPQINRRDLCKATFIRLLFFSVGKKNLMKALQQCEVRCLVKVTFLHIRCLSRSEVSELRCENYR